MGGWRDGSEGNGLNQASMFLPISGNMADFDAIYEEEQERLNNTEFLTVH